MKNLSRRNTAVVFSCAHTKPEVSNERFNWLGKFLSDLKPDYVIDLGDGADMCSLNQYDGKRPANVVTQSYQADINTYNDAMDRLKHTFRYNKKAMPKFYGFEGNHEHRIKVAIDTDPRLAGVDVGLSFDHLNTDSHFHEYHEYEYGAPSVGTYDGVNYAHFFTGGNMGRPIAGVHHAYALLASQHKSSTCGHTHKRDMYFKDAVPLIGTVVGCFKGAPEGWAGQANKDWWSGILVKRELRDGHYEPEWISLATLEKEYGDNS